METTLSETHVITIPPGVTPGILLAPSSSWPGMLEVEGFTQPDNDEAGGNEFFATEDSFGAAHAQVQIGFVLVRVNRINVEGLTVADQLGYLNSQISLQTGVELGLFSSKVRCARANTPAASLLRQCAECDVIVCCGEEEASVLCGECSVKQESHEKTVLSGFSFSQVAALPGITRKAPDQRRRRRRRRPRR